MALLAPPRSGGERPPHACSPTGLAGYGFRARCTIRPSNRRRVTSATILDETIGRARADPGDGAGASLRARPGDPQEAAAPRGHQGGRDRGLDRLGLPAARAAAPDGGLRAARRPVRRVGPGLPAAAPRRHRGRDRRRAEHALRAARQRPGALVRPGPAGHDRAAPGVLRRYRPSHPDRRVRRRHGVDRRGPPEPPALPAGRGDGARLPGGSAGEGPRWSRSRAASPGPRSRSTRGRAGPSTA